METLPDYKVVSLPMEEIFSDAEFNCRGKIAPIDVIDLAQSIRETGLQQPIAVQPYTDLKNPQVKYRIIAGHRRHMAFRINKEKAIPSMIKTGLSELDARLFNLTENLKRQELNILQEARALVPFQSNNWSEEFIAAKTGMSRGWVQVRLLLLRMPTDIQEHAAAGIFTQTQIRQLSSMDNDEKRYAAVRLILDRKEKGESTALEIKKPLKPHEKRERKISEIIALQDFIQEQVPNSIVTRILGWCGGFVSQYEIHREIRDFYATRGETYKIPKEITDNL